MVLPGGTRASSLKREAKWLLDYIGGVSLKYFSGNSISPTAVSLLLVAGGGKFG